MSKALDRATVLLWIVLTPLMSVALYMVFLYAPDEKVMGAAQRIFYFHVPTAMVTYSSVAVLLAGSILHPQGIRVTGSQGVLQMAGILGERFGRPGELVFLLGFWGAVATSILGVWQGVPYLFADYVGLLRGKSGDELKQAVAARGAWYRGYLLFLTLPPMAILAIGKPVWIVVAYAAIGALFMPFLALTLLWMNNREELGGLRNGPLANAGLVVCVLLFLYLGFAQIRDKVLGG